jgi:hypothetical protein
MFCYFSQEELIPAVAQHFAAQVWPLQPFNLLVPIMCGGKLNTGLLYFWLLYHS